MSSDGGNSQMGVLSALGLAVTSLAAIVICNKYLISTLGFCFATTLMSWHLLVTFCMLHVAQRLRFFEAKSIDAQTILFGFLNGISIGLLNLGFNSVGFYQMTKLAIYTLHHLSEQEVQGRDTSEHHTPSEHSEKRHQEQTHLSIQLVIVYWVMFWIYGRRFREETPSKPPGEDSEKRHLASRREKMKNHKQHVSLKEPVGLRPAWTSSNISPFLTRSQGPRGVCV